MVLRLITLIIGGIFLGFGLAVLFRGRYDLIRGYRPGLERYAHRAGYIDIAGGLVCIAGAIAHIFVENEWLLYITLFVGVGAILLFSGMNERNNGV